MSDVLTDGRKVRGFNVIEDCNREATAIEAILSCPARTVIKTLENLKEEIGTPKYIRYDNDPKFTSKTFTQWCVNVLEKLNILSLESRCKMRTSNDLTVF